MQSRAQSRFADADRRKIQKEIFSAAEALSPTFSNSSPDLCQTLLPVADSVNNEGLGNDFANGMSRIQRLGRILKNHLQDLAVSDSRSCPLHVSNVGTVIINTTIRWAQGDEPYTYQESTSRILTLLRAQAFHPRELIKRNPVDRLARSNRAKKDTPLHREVHLQIFN